MEPEDPVLRHYVTVKFVPLPPLRRFLGETTRFATLPERRDKNIKSPRVGVKPTIFHVYSHMLILCDAGMLIEAILKMLLINNQNLM